MLQLSRRCTCSALRVQVKVDDARRFEHQLLLTFERPLASSDSAQVSGGRVNETAECAVFFARVDAYAVQHTVSQCPPTHPPSDAGQEAGP